MIKGVKKILKRCPVAYSIADKVCDNLNPVRLKGIFTGTRAQEDYWAKRHLKKGGDWDYECRTSKNYWVSGYWESQRHQHRPLLVQKISKYNPLTSLLEVGCNCGPNLLLLAKALPAVKMYGIDINPVAIEQGRELFSTEGIGNVNLWVGRADELSILPDKSIDIVFMDAVLIYIGPDKIKRVIEEAFRVARLALIFLEQHDADAGALGKYWHGKWIRNYADLLKAYLPGGKLHLTKLTADQWPDRDWQAKGVIIEAVLTQGSSADEYRD